MMKKSTIILAFSPNFEIIIPKPVQNTITPKKLALIYYEMALTENIHTLNAVNALFYNWTR